MDCQVATSKTTFPKGHCGTLPSMLSFDKSVPHCMRHTQRRYLFRNSWSLPSLFLCLETPVTKAIFFNLWSNSLRVQNVQNTPPMETLKAK